VSASKFIEVSLIGTFVLSTYFESVANVGELRGSELKRSCTNTTHPRTTASDTYL